MTRYFFHLFNDEDVLDEEGTLLPGFEAACQHATREARVMAAEAVREHGRIVLSHKLVIADGSGAKLAVVTFGDAVSIVD